MNATCDLRCVADTRCRLGEAPLWHPEQGKLYWVDILAGTLFCYDPELGSYEELYAGDMIGGLVLQADGALLLLQEEGTVRSWHAGKQSGLRAADRRQRDYRFNDAIASPSGDVLCGVIESSRAPRSRLHSYQRRFRRLMGRFGLRRRAPIGLYRLQGSGQQQHLEQEAGLANGMGFSPDLNHFYFTDSARREIQVFDYDEGMARLANQRVFAKVPASEGFPDGLTVDGEGFVWSACWGGGCVVRYDSDGRIERKITLPAQNVTSLAFGGPAYRQLYITTAGGEDRERFGSGAGALFCATPGVEGKPEFRARLGAPEISSSTPVGGGGQEQGV
jgi:D-xylonolactonase